MTISMDAERGGGTAERTRHLALTLARQGADCAVLAQNGAGWRRQLADAGVKLWLTGSIGRRFPVPLPDPLKLWREIGRADVVHVMGYWYLLAALACLVSRICGRPYVLCPAGEFFAFSRPRPIQRLFHALLGRRMIAGAASLVASTALEAADIRRVAGECKRLFLSTNGIAEPGPQVMPRPDRPDLPQRFILFMGRLAPIKGPDLLIEAFATIAPRFPAVDLVLAGPDFGMRAALEQRCRALGIEHRVRFPGFVDEAGRLVAYRSALLLAVPSRSEVMSMVALEAGIAGTPVLLTDRCGFDEVGECGGGLVVAVDAPAIAAGLAALLERAEQLPAMGSRLRRLIRDNYAWSTVATRLRAHLASLAEDRSGF